MKRILVLIVAALAACEKAPSSLDEAAQQAQKAAEKAGAAAKEAAQKAAQEAGKKIEALPMTLNEEAAVKALHDIHRAQVKFKDEDLDRNSIKDYWTADVAGLYCLRHKSASKAPVGAIPIDLASADAAPYKGAYAGADYVYDKEMLKAHAPWAGYVFGMVAKDAGGSPYATDPDKSGKKVHHVAMWAACAWPAKYGQTGKNTFLINERGELYYKDTGGKPVAQWPDGKAIGKEWQKR
jgi:hypothetical protein